MTANLILLTVSALIVAIASFFWFSHPDLEPFGHQRYYTLSALFIGAILMLFALVRVIRGVGRTPAAPRPIDQDQAADRREMYRLVFDGPPRPVFLQQTDGPGSVPVFSCPVWDVSETGVSLDYIGSFAVGQRVQGEIIFDSGRTVPVNGVVTRAGSGRTALQLHCTIDPTIIMAEQRERIALQKNTGPMPAVAPTFSDENRQALPSHRPKGLCRLKRP